MVLIRAVGLTCGQQLPIRGPADAQHRVLVAVEGRHLAVHCSRAPPAALVGAALSAAQLPDLGAVIV